MHSTLQRLFVFGHHDEFKLSAAAQGRRHVVIGLVQDAVTATVTATLPGVLEVDERIVYVCCVATVSATTFLVLRTRVVHAI